MQRIFKQGKKRGPNFKLMGTLMRLHLWSSTRLNCFTILCFSRCIVLLTGKERWVTFIMNLFLDTPMCRILINRGRKMNIFKEQQSFILSFFGHIVSELLEVLI